MLHLDPEREFDRARRAFESHLARAKWMTEHGYRQVLRGGASASAVAARSGWHVERVFEDAGISGAKGRDERPGLDAMLKAVNAKEIDMVAAWSVDRLGRSLTDLLGAIRELLDRGYGAPAVHYCLQGHQP